MHEWSWATAGSQVVAFADAEARKEEEVRESMTSCRLSSFLRATFHRLVGMSEASLPQRAELLRSFSVYKTQKWYR